MFICEKVTVIIGTDNFESLEKNNWETFFPQGAIQVLPKGIYWRQI
jgi:hypothetical protein